MELLSLCPLPAAQLIWQSAPGRWAVTVVCKATYRLEPGVLALADQQEPVHHHESHWEDDPQRSLFAPADLVPLKPRADVLLIGNAYARNGQPVRSLVVRMNVGRVDKSIEVRGALSRARSGELREGKAWTKMPLHYERAAGGPGSENPVGIGPGGTVDARGELRLPNIQPPGFTVGAEHPPPIGFGPLAAHWPYRTGYLPRGAAGHDWVHAPFGDGFDPAHFQAAPPDQQLETLRPNERITLDNLHPKHARLVARLPGLIPRARVEPAGAPARELVLLPDTLWIDTRRSICTVSHRASLEVDHPEQEGRIVVTMVSTLEPFSPPAERRTPAPPPPAPPPPAESLVTETLPLPASPPPPPVMPLPVSHPPTMVAPPPPVARPPVPLPPVAEAPPVVTPSLPMSPPPSPVAPPARVTPPPFVAPVAWSAPPMASPPTMVAPPDAASLGLLSASNAAAGAREGAPLAELPAHAEPAAKSRRAPVVELVWFDAGAPLRLAQHPAFSAWSRPQPEPVPGDGKADPKGLLALHRAYVYDALTRGPLSSAGALDAALEAAEAESPPLPAVVLVTGTLDLCLDEAEMLKASAALREAWAKSNGLLAPEHLAACAERQLLEQRSYQKRELGGETWLRALLGGPGWETPIPVYFPLHVARKLPIFRRFPARLLGEVIWPQDQFEAHPLALRPLALGRLPLRSGIRARRAPAAVAR